MNFRNIKLEISVENFASILETAMHQLAPGKMKKTEHIAMLELVPQVNGVMGFKITLREEEVNKVELNE